MARSRSRNSLLSALLLLLGLWGRAAVAKPEDAQRAIREGVALHNGRKYTEAIARFQDAYKNDPSLTKTLLLIGAAYLNLGRPQQALEFYERYQRVEKDISAGDRLILLGYYGEEADKLLADYRADPQRPELLLFAGRARFKQGRTEEARSLYRLYQRDRPPGPDPNAALLQGYLQDAGLPLEEPPARREPPPKLAPRPAAPPPAPPRRQLPRPLWRLATGSAVMGVGLFVGGLGVSALSVDGSCVQQPVPAGGCLTDYDTHGIGSVLLASGVVLAVGGAVLIAWPERRHRR